MIETEMDTISDGTYFGPSYVIQKDVDAKLYNFCKQSFPSFSKRKLRECFKNGYVVVNDVPIRAGHIDEMRRLLNGDKVEIFLNLIAMDRMKLDGIKLDIRYESAGFVIINKLSGISVAPDKEYEKALKILLWNGEYRDSCKLLYHLEKSLNGLCIVAQTMPHYKRIRDMMVVKNDNSVPFSLSDCEAPSVRMPQIALTYRAVVCGFIGEAGSTVDVPTTYYDMPTLSVQVISTSRCRSCNYLSLVDISPVMFGALRMGTADRGEYTLTNDPSMSHIRDKYQMYTESFLDTLERPVTGADYKVLHYPTKYIKSIKRALMRAGHAVVGDGDMVKKSKGIHAALVAIRINAPVDATAESTATEEYPVVIEIPTPDKFAKLLLREERMWHLANDRDQDKLLEHKERQNTGGRKGNRNKKSAKPIASPVDLAIEAVEGAHIKSESAPPLNDSSDEENESDNDEKGGDDEDSSSGSDSDRDVSSSSPNVDHDLPVEYRIGESAFCGTVFTVNSHVMIPRKSSEALVSEAVRLLTVSVTDDDSGVRVLDLGTGSGCLLLSCMAQLNKLHAEWNVSGVGVDISSEALNVARENAQRLSLSNCADFVEGSFEELLQVLRTVGGQRPFDLVLCNPPYSSKKDRTRLSVSRRSHEPEIALYAPRSVSIASGESSTVLQGGTMGAYHMIARSMRAIHAYHVGLGEETSSDGAPLLLRDGAHLVIEMGHGQEKQVRAILDAAKCMQFVRSVRDHLDIVRCVVYKYCLCDEVVEAMVV